MTVDYAPAPPFSPQPDRDIMMSETIKRPKRKNPILKTRSPTLPPDRRSRIALGLVRGAALGQLELRSLSVGRTRMDPDERTRRTRQ
jgi:hypothetical protein